MPQVHKDKPVGIMFVNEAKTLVVVPKIIRQSVLVDTPMDLDNFVYYDSRVPIDVSEDGIYTIECDGRSIKLRADQFRMIAKDFEDDIKDFLWDSQELLPLEISVGAFISDGRAAPECMTTIFSVEYGFDYDFDENCAVCTMHKKHAFDLIQFLNGTTFIEKETMLKTTVPLTQTNLKQAIFVNDSSVQTILNWFVENFSVTFKMARIKTITFRDAKSGIPYTTQIIGD